MHGIQIFSLSCAREMLITDLISSPNFIKKHLYEEILFFYFRGEIKHEPHPYWSFLLKRI